MKQLRFYPIERYVAWSEGLEIRIPTHCYNNETVAFANKIAEKFPTKKWRIIDHVVQDLYDFYCGYRGYPEKRVRRELDKPSYIEVESPSCAVVHWDDHYLDEHYISCEIDANLTPSHVGKDG